jgi:hypothetical protein
VLWFELTKTLNFCVDPGSTGTYAVVFVHTMLQILRRDSANAAWNEILGCNNPINRGIGSET